MDFKNVGREFYPNREIFIWYNPDEKFSLEMNDNKRFRLVFIKKGTGILKIDGIRIMFNSPCLFCLDEKETTILEKSLNYSAVSIYFHPNTVNSSLNFENLRNYNVSMSHSEKAEITFLSPFFLRSDLYHGYMEIGINLEKKISQLMACIDKELAIQRDEFWPCRSRSFLLELLICVERLYLAPNRSEDLMVNENFNDFDNLILYLNSNYNKKITISDLSRVFNINRTTLNKQFNRLTNMSIMTYLINFRIKLASVILKDTLLPISEISERVGFGDVSSFTRTFKKQIGFSPSEYRQNNFG